MPLLQTAIYTLEVEIEPSSPEIDDTITVIHIHRVLDPQEYDQGDIDDLVGASLIVTNIIGHGMGDTILADLIED